MIKIDAVIGSGFGDEGKGKTTAFIAHNSTLKSIVIRFNGGAQAGHTFEGNVNNKEIRHVFSHIGSAAFIGKPTFLSKFFISNPILFRDEYRALEKYMKVPNIYVSGDSLITTPFDMMLNRILEMSRINRHGSVGLGINETIKRSEYEKFKLTVSDLSDTDFGAKINLIKNEWVPFRVSQFKNDPNIDKHKLALNLSMFDVDLNIVCANFMTDCEFFSFNTFVLKDSKLSFYFDHLIFEGAQGLALDRDHKNFPFVTNSKTDLTNVTELLDLNLCYEPITVWFPMRCYSTKHGAGFFGNEREAPFSKINDSTNVTGQWQGSLRFSYLHLSDIFSDLNKCISAASEKRKLKYNVVVNCLDQVAKNDDVKYIWKGQETFLGKGQDGIKNLLEKINSILNPSSLYYSYSPDFKRIETFET